MTDESEKSLENRIEELLVDHYGEDAVDRQHYYQTRRWVDLYVDMGILHLAIECENDAPSIIEGVAQALLYANHDQTNRTVPMVVIPDDHGLDAPEMQYLNQEVPILTESAIRAALSTTVV